LPVAERLDLLEETAVVLHKQAGALFFVDRFRQAMITYRGTHELSAANGITEVERNCKTALTFYEQFNDPAAGLAMAREGLELAATLGSSSYAFRMIGNAASCAFRTGDWEWSSGVLDEWLDREVAGWFFLELYVDRAILSAVRGQDPEPDLAAAAGLLPEDDADTQYLSYIHWARAWRSLAAGELSEARAESEAAAEATTYFLPFALPLAARAALWDDDLAAARDIIERCDASLLRGRAAGVDRVTVKAGLAAREGKRTEAVAGYREAFRGWRQLGCAFDEALVALDMALLLAPTPDEMEEASADIDGARSTLEQLGARPLVARLTQATADEPHTTGTSG
jgi:hypothetical protein